MAHQHDKVLEEESELRLGAGHAGDGADPYDAYITLGQIFEGSDQTLNSSFGSAASNDKTEPRKTNDTLLTMAESKTNDVLLALKEYQEKLN